MAAAAGPVRPEGHLGIIVDSIREMDMTGTVDELILREEEKAALGAYY